jgi:hypothetical protein
VLCSVETQNLRCTIPYLICVGIDLDKAAFVTPLYLSVSWTLMTSYQLFTQTAVTSVVTHINALWPSVGLWLYSRQDMLVFIYAFAWVFILSSVIPSVILGRERNVLAQFVVCLTSAFSAFLLADALTAFSGGPLTAIFSVSMLFTNPFFAVIYLSFPYIFMITLDLYFRKKLKRKENLEKKSPDNLDEAVSA